MTDLEVLICLICWAFIIVSVYVFGKTGIIEKYIENGLSDTEQVIRCENCKYYDKDMGACFVHWEDSNPKREIVIYPDFDDYCSFAERKEQ